MGRGPSIEARKNASDAKRGMTRIHGIDPGAYVKATGLICRPTGTPTIYNPAYELLPQHG